MLFLYFTGAIAGTGGFTGQRRPSYINDISCIGSEASLFECSHVIDSILCTPNNIAGVICQGKYSIIIMYNVYGMFSAMGIMFSAMGIWC